jgi:DnaJ-class molecular chaperone
VTQEQVPCSNCRSTGQVFREKDRCKKCKGECVTEEKKVLEVYIPRGSKEGDKIVLEGEADEQPGSETGDIVFILEEKEHDVFTRVGSDLSATLKVSLVESLTGFSRVVVKHLDGRGIQLTHPVGEVLKPGQVLKIAGEGMPHKKGEGKGDLYLIVEIEFPEDGWKPDVEAIRAALPASKQEPIAGEPVDEHEYIRNASLEDVSCPIALLDEQELTIERSSEETTPLGKTRGMRTTTRRVALSVRSSSSPIVFSIIPLAWCCWAVGISPFSSHWVSLHFFFRWRMGIRLLGFGSVPALVWHTFFLSRRCVAIQCKSYVFHVGLDIVWGH